MCRILTLSAPKRLACGIWCQLFAKEESVAEVSLAFFFFPLSAWLPCCFFMTRPVSPTPASLKTNRQKTQTPKQIQKICRKSSPLMPSGGCERPENICREVAERYNLHVVKEKKYLHPTKGSSFKRKSLVLVSNFCCIG